MKHMTKMGLACAAIMICLVASDAAQAQRGRGGGGGRGGSGGGGAGESQDSIKPYDEVITEKAESKTGLFMTHMIDDKLFYEIPSEQLSKDMLWVVQIGKTQAGFSYAGMPVLDRVVRWELRGEEVLLRDVKYSIRADNQGAINLAVESTNVAPIIMTFPVKAWGKDQRPVIEVTNLFKNDVSEISARRTLNAQSLESSRTYIEEVKPFDNNLETKVLATYRLSSGGSAAEGGGRRGGRGARRDPSQSVVTALIHHSMKKLPEDPMKPRVYDERVGFFNVGFQDYADDEYHEVEEVRFITRWRLEKKDPSAEVSEPVEPIKFYVGRAVPEKWKPYVKQGIEKWQPAFEKAGFKNAIIGEYAPTPQEDPNWDAEDSSISTIRWLPSTTENAFGPHVHDPRTGEILEADVRIYHNVLKLCRDWYFVQASANDERAQKLPLPDDLVGELLAYVVAHEVGHSIGFPHNMKASSAYTVENLRDPEFTKTYGVEASIMDYGRFNYVAQPGDGATLIPMVGPYDDFAVKWGYGQYENDEKEQEGLAALLEMQKEDPMLRFGNADPREDPTRQTEDLGSDAMLATELGLKNIDRIAAFLVAACCKEGEDYELLENMYQQLMSQRTRELMHVTALVGGFEEINLFFGDADQVYHPLISDRQRDAIKFLNQHAFQTPVSLVNPDITLRLEASGVADRVLSSQRSILSSLISDERVKRMAEHVQRSQSQDSNVYKPQDMLADLRGGIWTELTSEKLEVDLFRRNLQRTHLNVLCERAKSDSVDSDLPALCRAELRALKESILPRLESADPLTKAHLEQILSMIDEVLNPAVRIEAETSSDAQGPGQPGGLSTTVNQ